MKPADLQRTIELIKRFEGIEDGDPTTVNLDPYLCPADYWTIGWGHVVLNPDGQQLRGEEAWQHYQHTGVSTPADEVLAKLQTKLDARRKRLGA